MSNTFLLINQFCVYIRTFGFYSNLIFGSIFTYFTLFYIEKQFGSYKKLLVNFQIVGFLFAFYDFLAPTFMHSYNRALICFSFSHSSHLSSYFFEWTLAVFSGLFSTTMCILAIQFLFRFWAVFDQPKLVYFKGINYFIWIVYYIVFSGFWVFGVGYLFAVGDSGKEYLANEMLVTYRRNIYTSPVLSLIAYENNHINWKCTIGLLILSVVCGVQYFIICVCAFKMCREMSGKLKEMSQLHQRIHKQFFKVLLIQTFTPSIFIFGPMFFMLLIPYADLEIRFPSSIFVSGFTVYPAIDSICIMCCVSEYGKCFKKLTDQVRTQFGGRWKPFVKPTVSYNLTG